MPSALNVSVGYLTVDRLVLAAVSAVSAVVFPSQLHEEPPTPRGSDDAHRVRGTGAGRQGNLRTGSKSHG